MSLSPMDLAQHYLVDDIPAAISIGDPLHSLLEAIFRNEPLSASSYGILASHGLSALRGFTEGNMTLTEFRRMSGEERAQRSLATGFYKGRKIVHSYRPTTSMPPAPQRESEQVKRMMLLHEQQRKLLAHNVAAKKGIQGALKAIEARLNVERVKRVNDPEQIARVKNQALREKYAVLAFVEPDHFKPLMAILDKLDAGTRLLEAETIWLKSTGRKYETKAVVHAHNRLEADHWLAEYRNSKNPWSAVNASGHLRKCAASGEAITLLAAIPAKRQEQPKLKSAILTTHGGALRDQGNRTDAMAMGEEAHRLQPKNFRPCTLLGAVCMELGMIVEGHEWYGKAEVRGASRDSIEADVRSLLTRMTAERRDSVVAELLRIDPAQYRWLRKLRTA